MSTVLFPSIPDSEIVSTRIVPFSIDLVYEAWSNPNHLKNWWGPKGFTNTFAEHDLRVGGKWSFVMDGPDKGNYANECEFIKIEKPTLIAWKRHSKPLFKIVAAFKKVTDDATEINFRMLFDTAEESNKLRPYVIDKNEENFDRLEAELHKMKTD